MEDTANVQTLERRISFEAPDGFPLGGLLREPAGCDRPNAVVVITCATSVRCRYYARFADYLCRQGFAVLTYDYRGIGESRPKSLRGFRADWIDWGELDLEAALRFARKSFPESPIDVVAHSIGGFAVGLAPSNGDIRRIMTVGAQFAYWRDYERSKRFSMVWKWHVVMPLLTRLIGYFPAKRLRWMEDTPKGVALDWSRMGPRFEDTVRYGQMRGARRESDCLRDRFQQVTAPILAISLTDDEYGTVAAVERLLAYFDCSERQHLRIAPQDIGHAAIGHFAFFHDRYRDTLWPLALDWLQHGQTSADFCTHPFPR